MDRIIVDKTLRQAQEFIQNNVEQCPDLAALYDNLNAQTSSSILTQAESIVRKAHWQSKSNFDSQCFTVCGCVFLVGAITASVGFLVPKSKFQAKIANIGLCMLGFSFCMLLSIGH